MKPMTNRLFYFLLLGLSLCNIQTLQADEPLSNDIQLRLGGYFIADQSTDLLVTRNGLGATINLQKLFNMEEYTQVFRLDGFYRFAPKHRVEFAWYNINNSNKTASDAEFEWGDGNISANGALNTHLNTDIYKINYVYSFYRSNELEAGLAAGLHITAIDIGFQGDYNVDGNLSDTSSERVKVTAPLPVIGFRFSYNILKELSVKYATDFFFLTFDQYKGAMTDTLLTLDYRFTDHLGVGIGFNSTRMRVEGPANDDYDFYLQHDVSGGLFYATLTY